MLRGALCSFEDIWILCWYLFNFVRKLDITDIVQRLDISKTGYLTHLVNVSDTLRYCNHFQFQEVKFASHILFRYFGIFNVIIVTSRMLTCPSCRSDSGWWRLASLGRTKLGRTLIDLFTSAQLCRYWADQDNHFYESLKFNFSLSEMEEALR